MKAIVGKPASAAGSKAAAVSGSVIGGQSRTSLDAGPRKQRSKAPAKAAEQSEVIFRRVHGENHSATTGTKSGITMPIPPPGIKLIAMQLMAQRNRARRRLRRQLSAAIAAFSAALQHRRGAPVSTSMRQKLCPSIDKLRGKPASLPCPQVGSFDSPQFLRDGDSASLLNYLPSVQ